MKFGRRQPPADFGATGQPSPGPAAPETVNDPLLAPTAEVEAAEATTDTPPAQASARQAAPAAPLDPPASRGQVARAAIQPPARRTDDFADAREAFRAPPAWPVYLIALAVSVLWAVGPIAFAVGYRNRVAPLTEDVFALAVFALLAIGPAIFVWGCAYMIRQGQKLGAEAKRAKAMAEDMLSPAVVAAARAGHVVQAVRDEIVAAGQAADQARETLMALRQAVADETLRLTDATRASVRTAQDLAGTLGKERTEIATLADTLDARAAQVADTIGGQARRVVEASDAASERLRVVEEELAQTLDARAAKITEAIGNQARMVAEAADVAETQLREAEGVMAARAADLAAAAGEVGDAARTAGEDLTRHIARLETAGSGVAEQVKAVEGGLIGHRTALVTLSQALKADHAGFAAEAEAHAAQLGEFISQARLSAAEMSERAMRGSETLKALMADAAEQFRDLAETARAEREEFGQSTLQSLDAVSSAAAEQRLQLEAQTRAAIDALARAAEETREAAASHAATAREQVDQLSEAAFTAGQKANQVFEARLAEARALVEQSSQMVEEAGKATARKLEEGAAAARETLTELEQMLGELEARARQIPVAAQGQAEQVRETVVQGMDELMAAARRTAEEAQAIDAAFQERVRRNFEMLSEAVRLMGSVAGGPQPPSAPAPLAPPLPLRAVPPPTFSASAAFTQAPRAPEPAVAEPEPPPAMPEDLLLDEIAEPVRKSAKGKKAPAPEAEVEAEGPAGALAARLGLRPRLKLTPTATDEEFSQVFEAAGGPPPAETKGEGWSWKDLLATVDGGSGDGADLQAALAAELAGMGVDPAKLLPKARIDEIAAAVQVGDLDGARQVVKKLAPAATRRIVRRLFTDEALKARVMGFIGRHQAMVDDAVVRDPEGFLMAELLGSDAGRIYLLLDAAVGDAA